MKYLLILIFVLSNIILAQSYSSRNHFFRNDFPTGQVKIDGTNYTVSAQPQHWFLDEIGVWFSWNPGDEVQTHNAEAYQNQSVNGQHSFYQWNRDGALATSSRFYTVNVSYGTDLEFIHEAQYWSTVNVTANNSTGFGTVKVNYVPYISPKTVQVFEAVGVTLTAVDHEQNGIIYSFLNWNDDNSTTRTESIAPNQHTTYTAYFSGRPKFSGTYRNLHFGTQIGQKIKLYWNEHPNPQVTKYYIYRKGKTATGGDLPLQLISVKNRGTTSYTDPEYKLTAGYIEALLQYDVRAYYVTENSYSEEAFVACFGEETDISPELDDKKEDERSALKNDIMNYPNPFNPQTVIRYSLMEASMTKLSVFNSIGEEIKTLVNEFKFEGAHEVSFNGADLPSGIYFYRIQSGKFVETKKLILMK